MPKVRPTRSIIYIYIYISSSFYVVAPKANFVLCVFLKHTRSIIIIIIIICFSLNDNDNDTFALSRVALDFGGKPSGDECSSIIPIKLPERQRRRGDETSAFVRTIERERERDVFWISIVPKRDGGKKKNLDAARSSLRPRLSLSRASAVSFERRLSTFRRREGNERLARLVASFLFCAHANYVPLF